MIDDPRRTSAYLTALRATIRPGDLVLEIGTGFGFFAIEAARLGAAHVWALEPNDAIDIGPELAARHGVADRITFVQRRSTEFELPRRADVLLEDLRGVSPLLGARLAILRDARERLLRPDARFIAQRDRLYAVPALPHPASPAPAAVVEGIDVGVARVRAANGWRRIDADAIGAIAPADCWATLELGAVESPDVSGSATFTVAVEGALGGWATWFDVELAGGARFTSGPGDTSSVYGCAFYPLSEPVQVRAGDRLDLQLRATFDGSDHVWAWDTTITPAGSSAAPRRIRQSDLAARALSAERRHRRAASHVPMHTASHRLEQDLLALVDGVRPVEAIAAELRARHPDRFGDARRALTWAGDALARYDESAGP